ncbi:HAD-IA family hydrolase [Scleromatobacter humisilvae]|uniref:HAD-IA family hydrolase n=1 Tax=Scleromatobacter humisilvae TaxID=2897159 RepID=A0A9X1YKK6_9BURK|nr:HAD-IA family hydrolase [Scleromatobacter humisilvae]MCK9687447.1 HAD-IA family hydrolase [Scleromatobacter humisilvae]
MNRPDLPDRAYAAFLFDMDGTILSSIACAERVWTRWALRHGLDVAAFLPTIHGMRAIETVRSQNLAGVDAEAEAARITAEEMDDVEGIAEIAGVAAFMAALPAGRWAVVTSAPRELATRRIVAAGLPLPPLLVSADDVAQGKPAPDCFLLAASRLGVRASDCLVFEDAPAGIAAAEAAGASVLVITATHAHPLDTPHPGVGDYVKLAPRVDADGRLRLVATGA